MYEECLAVFNSMSYSKHALDTGRPSFDANYTILSQSFYDWKDDMLKKYRRKMKQGGKFSESVDQFMNHLFFLYASLSPEKMNADIEHRPHFEFTEEMSIYSKFYAMMMASPWLRLNNDENALKEWKNEMTWMGKRVYCITYYNNPQLSWQQYKNVRETIDTDNVEELWNVGAPTWSILSRNKPSSWVEDSHRLQLTTLLRSLNTYS